MIKYNYETKNLITISGTLEVRVGEWEPIAILRFDPLCNTEFV